MDIFDQYLFDEIVEEYNRTDLSSEDYEEIYQRFLNIEHISEVKPYILTMRFLGLGTEAEQGEVLDELRGYLDSNDAIMCGLYYDLLLYKDRDDSESENALLDFVKKGYSDAYLKNQSHINFDISTEDEKKLEYAKFASVIAKWINQLSKKEDILCRQFSLVDENTGVNYGYI